MRYFPKEREARKFTNFTRCLGAMLGPGIHPMDTSARRAKFLVRAKKSPGRLRQAASFGNRRHLLRPAPWQKPFRGGGNTGLGFGSSGCCSTWRGRRVSFELLQVRSQGAVVNLFWARSSAIPPNVH